MADSCLLKKTGRGSLAGPWGRRRYSVVLRASSKLLFKHRVESTPWKGSVFAQENMKAYRCVTRLPSLAFALARVLPYFKSKLYIFFLNTDVLNGIWHIMVAVLGTLRYDQIRCDNRSRGRQWHTRNCQRRRSICRDRERRESRLLQTIAEARPSFMSKDFPQISNGLVSLSTNRDGVLLILEPHWKRGIGNKTEVVVTIHKNRSRGEVARKEAVRVASCSRENCLESGGDRKKGERALVHWRPGYIQAVKSTLLNPDHKRGLLA